MILSIIICTHNRGDLLKLALNSLQKQTKTGYELIVVDNNSTDHTRDLVLNFKIKNVKINAYQVGLVFENRKLIKVLEEGAFWIFGNKEVKIYEKNQSFVPPIELNILLENQELASLLEVVEVADNEIALYIVNGIFKEPLSIVATETEYSKAFSLASILILPSEMVLFA